MKNEQGYTLVTVLITITVFMVIFLSFIGQSFSSVKQNQVVEKNSKSVTIAEMGISYYQIMVQNLYTTYKQTVTNTVKNTIEQDLTAKRLKPANEYALQAAELMKNYIKQELNKEVNAIPIEGKPSSSFKIVEKNYYTTTDNKILLKIMGSDQGKNTTLSTEMTLGILPTITGLSSSGGSNNYTPQTFNTISKPVLTNSDCKNPSTIKSNCAQILIEVPKTISENFNGLKGKTIYATDVLTLGGNGNKSSFTLHSENNITINGNLNNTSDIFLETKKNATFGGQVRPSSSHIYIGQDLTVSGHFEIANNSIVYVGRNTEISGKLTINSGSKMCVVGSLTVDKKKTIIGELIEKSKVSDAVFLQKCGISTTPVLSISWGDTLINSAKYEY